jgi:RNA polymerase sigma-70 factor (ECF subfamily)
MDGVRSGGLSEGELLEQRSDEQLLLDYRARNDRGAFDELVHRYEGELYSYLRRFLGTQELAEDVFQGTFLQIHLKRDQFQEGRRLRPWLYTIATNQAIDAQRRGRKHRNVSLDHENRSGEDDIVTLLDLLSERRANPARQLEEREQIEWVRRAMSELPEVLKSVVQLVYFQGLKYRDAAEVLGIPVGTVKSRLHAAILKLHEAWNRSHPSGAD